MSEKWCPLCERNVPRLSRHHLIPKSKGGRRTAKICEDCHRTIHAFYPNALLESTLNSVEALQNEPMFARHLEWRNTAIPHEDAQEARTELTRNEGTPMGELIDRRYYKFRGRNYSYGVWCAEAQGFLGLRNKFGLRLEHEFHNECGPPYGTVFGPMEDLGIDLPADIENKEMLDTVDKVTGRVVEWDDNLPNPNKSVNDRLPNGWYRFKDDGSPAPASRDENDNLQFSQVIYSNEKLFNWLVEQERRMEVQHFVKRDCGGCGDSVTAFDECSCVLNFELEPQYRRQRCHRCWRQKDGWECAGCDSGRPV